MGWSIYKFTVDMNYGIVMAAFLGSFILAMMSHTMSRRYKRPVIIFIVPGIIPLVPGGAAYEATRLLVTNAYTRSKSIFRGHFNIRCHRIRNSLCRNLLLHLYTT